MTFFIFFFKVNHKHTPLRAWPRPLLSINLLSSCHTNQWNGGEEYWSAPSDFSQQKVPDGSDHKLWRRLSKRTAPYGDETRSHRLVWSFYTSPCKDKKENLPAKHESPPESAPSALVPVVSCLLVCLICLGCPWNEPRGSDTTASGIFDTRVSFKT